MLTRDFFGPPPPLEFPTSNPIRDKYVKVGSNHIEEDRSYEKRAGDGLEIRGVRRIAIFGRSGNAMYLRLAVGREWEDMDLVSGGRPTKRDAAEAESASSSPPPAY